MPATSAVLINNYNNGPFINECVESVLAQTAQPTEIIFHDDDSTDGSLDILQRFHPKVKVIKNNQRVSSNSINQANAITRLIELASSDYVFLLDADDAFKPRKIETYLKHFSNGYDMIQSPVQIIDNNSTPIKTHRYEQAHVTSIKENILKTNQANHHYMTSSLAFSRDFISKSLPINVSRYKYLWADSYLSLFSFAKGKIITLEEELTFYRKHGSNLGEKFATKRSRLALNRERIHLFNKFSPRKIAFSKFIVSKILGK